MNKREKQETIETFKESYNFLTKTYSLIALVAILPFIITWLWNL